MGQPARPRDFSPEDDDVILWFVINCPHVTSWFNDLCDELYVRGSGERYLPDETHRRYARERVRNFRKKQPHELDFDQSYDPFENYLVPTAKASEIINGTIGTMSSVSTKSPRTRGKKTGRNTENSPPRKTRSGGFAMGELANELNVIASATKGTANTSGLRVVDNNDYNAKFTLGLGHNVVHGSVIESIYEKKKNKDETMVYMVNKTMIQVPPNCVTGDFLFTSAELVLYKKGTSTTAPAFLVTYYIDIQDFFDDQGEVEECNAKVWGEESQALVNEAKSWAIKTKKDGPTMVKYLYTIPSMDPNATGVAENFTNEEFNYDYDGRAKTFSRPPPTPGFLLATKKVAKKSKRGYITVVVPVAGTGKEIEEKETYDCDDDAGGFAAFAADQMADDPPPNDTGVPPKV